MMMMMMVVRIWVNSFEERELVRVLEAQRSMEKMRKAFRAVEQGEGDGVIVGFG
jgi:hypothetical protein